ncbi:MAG: hypothetical protein Q7W30_05015 [Coriobacteriia bacterium]|nr:hypothetical protein [Coriobacteriia bacterium]
MGISRTPTSASPRGPRESMSARARARRALALAGVHLRVAAFSPFTWGAVASGALYTVLAAVASDADLRMKGLRLSMLEAGFYMANDAYYVTFGLLFCFLLAASAMFRDGDLETLLVVRSGDRRTLWAGRSLALAGLTCAYLASMAVVWLAVIVPGHPVTAGWSPAYERAAALVLADPGGIDPVLRAAADPHLLANYSPLELAALCGALYALVFVTVGILAAVLAQTVRRRAPAILLTFGYGFAYVVLAAIGLKPWTVLTPQGHLLLAAHTPGVAAHVSYPVSFAAWGATLALALWWGRNRTLRAVLG